MTRRNVFAARNAKEMLRDPVSLVFCVGLPVALLIMMYFLGRNVPVETFSLENFTPGIAMFSLSFLSMFSGTLIAGDRGSAFLTRLFASPLTAADFILGYALPLLPMAVAQMALCFLVAFILGLPVTLGALASIAVLLPIAVFFIGLGLLLGSLLSAKQVPPITSIIVQVVALGSGMWFDLSMLGGIVRGIGYALPFAHALDAARGALAGQWAGVWGHLAVCAAWAVPVFALAVWMFRRQMRG